MNLTSNQQALFDHHQKAVLRDQMRIQAQSEMQSIANDMSALSERYRQLSENPHMNTPIALCPTEIIAPLPTSIFFNPADLPSTNSLDNTVEGIFPAVGSPVAGDSSITQVLTDPLGHYGADRSLFLPAGVTEAWISYWVRLGPNWTVDKSTKLPGFATQVTGGANGGQGGLGGGGNLAFSIRSLIQGRGLGFVDDGMGSEIYYDMSTNQPNGQTSWWGDNAPSEPNPQLEARVFQSSWRRIVQHVKINDINSNNGVFEVWFDVVGSDVSTGQLAFRRTDLGLTDNPAHRNLRFWFNVFIGGSEDGTNTQHDIYFDRFNYNAGASNATVE